MQVSATSTELEGATCRKTVISSVYIYMVIILILFFLSSAYNALLTVCS